MYGTKKFLRNITGFEKNKNIGHKIATTVFLCFCIGSLSAYASSNNQIAQHKSNTGNFQQSESGKTEIISITNKENFLTENDINILIESYTNQPSIEAAQMIIDGYLLFYDYENAYKRIQLKQKKFNTTNRTSYVFVLLNISPINASEMDNISSYLDELYQNKKIESDTYYLHKALVALHKDNMQYFWIYLDEVSTTGQYQGLQQSLYGVNNLAFTDSPEYYKSALIAQALFSYGYINTAQHVAQEILLINNSYTLAHQLVAYSAFLQNNTELAHKHLTHLMRNDENNREQYLLMRGILSYESGEYDKSSLLLGQVSEDPLVYRYNALIALANDRLDEYLSEYKKIIQIESMSEYDIFTFFRSLFFKENSRKIWQSLNNTEKATVAEIINQCKTKYQNTILCDYGVSGYQLAIGQKKKGIELLDTIAPTLHQEKIYNMLADYFASESSLNIDKAKNYYMLAMGMTKSNANRSQYKESLIDVILQSRAK